MYVKKGPVDVWKGGAVDEDVMYLRKATQEKAAGTA